MAIMSIKSNKLRKLDLSDIISDLAARKLRLYSPVRLVIYPKQIVKETKFESNVGNFM